MDLLKTLYQVIGAPYPLLSLFIVSCIGAVFFGGGWWLIGQQYSQDQFARQAPAAATGGPNSIQTSLSQTSLVDADNSDVEANENKNVPTDRLLVKAKNSRVQASGNSFAVPGANALTGASQPNSPTLEGKNSADIKFNENKVGANVGSIAKIDGPNRLGITGSTFSAEEFVTAPYPTGEFSNATKKDLTEQAHELAVEMRALQNKYDASRNLPANGDEWMKENAKETLEFSPLQKKALPLMSEMLSRVDRIKRSDLPRDLLTGIGAVTDGQLAGARPIAGAAGLLEYLAQELPDQRAK